VSVDDCRSAVCTLNEFRFNWVEFLREGYDCLEELVFTPTLKDVLTKYTSGMITARTKTKYDNLEKSTRAQVENALSGRDSSDLRASLRRALSFSTPPLILYRTSAYSDPGLIFGVPLLDLETNEDDVPKVMRMCIEEVEKRGLNAPKLYSVGDPLGPPVVELRRRFESEGSFSFKFTDNVFSVAMLLMRYLWDLPEPLFVLPMQYYREYKQIRAKYIENDFSLLRSKLHELHPVHRASLEALLRHLSRVASHSEKNAMTVEVLATQFRYIIFRGNEVLQDGVQMKALALEDLIRNVHILFDEQPSPSTVPSPHMAETTELPQPSKVDAMGSTTRHRPGLVGVIPTSTPSSLPSDIALESRLTPSLPTLPSPILGLPLPNTLVEGVETASQEQVRGSEAADTLGDSAPPEDVAISPTSVTEWRSRLSPLPPEAVTTLQSPPESVSSSTTDSPLSSIMSL